ncbi:XisH family protein [Dapis sp. BLCC M229]|uniref:XisH family protein n=1 Tax=Dapis sp. BLCC M229 TaxID=3400188 RepID=UPI003CE87DD3
MSAKDIFHNTVRSALEKEGWIITHDPLFIKVEELDFFIDLAGEKFIGAEKDGLKIAVEIKSFIGASDLTSFYGALGQFLSYRSALRKKQPERVLYLAISQDIYSDFFSNQFIQELIAEHQLKLVIFEVMKEEIVLWKE